MRYKDFDLALQDKAARFSAVHFAHDGHWAPRGHEVAAGVVAEWLRGQGIGG